MSMFIIKESNFEHNRIVSRHKASVSSTNVNCLVSEEVQHGGLTCTLFLLIKSGPGALICGFPWIYYVIEQKHPPSSPRSSPWPGKVPTIAQFSIF